MKIALFIMFYCVVSMVVVVNVFYCYTYCVYRCTAMFTNIVDTIFGVYKVYVSELQQGLHVGHTLSVFRFVNVYILIMFSLLYITGTVSVDTFE